MVLNTTNGASGAAPRGTRSYVNTTAILEEPLMTFEDESPDILTVLPGGAWQAEIGDAAVPVLAFVVLDDSSMFGVAVGSNGLIDLSNNVEKHPGFTGYTNNNDKEK